MKRLLVVCGLAAVGLLYFACEGGPPEEGEATVESGLTPSSPLLWGSQPRTMKYQMTFTDGYNKTPSSEVHTWTFTVLSNRTVQTRLDLPGQPAAWQATYTFDPAGLVLPDNTHSNILHRDLPFFRLPNDGSTRVSPPTVDSYVGLTQQNQWVTTILQNNPGSSIVFAQTQSWLIPHTNGLLQYYMGAPFYMDTTTAQAAINKTPTTPTPYYKVSSATYNVVDSSLTRLSGDMILYTDGGYAGNLATDPGRTHLDLVRIQ